MTPERCHYGATRYRVMEMQTMMADYNGWADEREDEREALDQLDLTLTPAVSARRHLPALRALLLRATAREIVGRPA